MACDSWIQQDLNLCNFAPVNSGADDDHDRVVQKGVAQKMLTYYNEQKAAGNHLLAVIALGDNFYFSGQNCELEFEDHWRRIYGELTDASIPWLSVYGNHDFGNHDAWAICAFNRPRHIDSVTGMAYSANQLNVD